MRSRKACLNVEISMDVVVLDQLEMLVVGKCGEPLPGEVPEVPRLGFDRNYY